MLLRVETGLATPSLARTSLENYYYFQREIELFESWFSKFHPHLKHSKKLEFAAIKNIFSQTILAIRNQNG